MISAKLYVDHLSQPSRSCMLLCRLNPEQCEKYIQESKINIAKGETRSPGYRAINPLGKVPYFCNEAQSIRLPESSAIMKFVCDTYGLPDHWYPRDPYRRAMIDAAMAWHASTLRIGSMIVVFNRALSHTLGKQGDEQLVKSYGLPMLKSSLSTLEHVWLAGKCFVSENSRVLYIAGADISIADLLIASEIEQLVLLNPTNSSDATMDALLCECPRVNAWMNQVRTRCQPQWNAVHALLYKLEDRHRKSRL